MNSNEVILLLKAHIIWLPPIYMIIFFLFQVSVFGFGADENGNWHHYFEQNKHHRNAGNHGGSYEYLIALKLHEKKGIRLYKGW